MSKKSAIILLTFSTIFLILIPHNIESQGWVECKPSTECFKCLTYFCTNMSNDFQWRDSAEEDSCLGQRDGCYPFGNGCEKRDYSCGPAGTCFSSGGCVVYVDPADQHTDSSCSYSGCSANLCRRTGTYTNWRCVGDSCESTISSCSTPCSVNTYCSGASCIGGNCASDSCGATTLNKNYRCNGGGSCLPLNSYTCDSGTHTNCQSESCLGTDYNCTFDGSTWEWRTSNPSEVCNDGVDNDCDTFVDGDDLDCNTCDATNVCDEYEGKYCDGTFWVGGSSHNFACGTCRTCGGTAALNEGDLSCDNLITGDSGLNCNGLCEYCNNGLCDPRAAQTDIENECPGNCNACNGARACQNYNVFCTGNCDVCSGGNCAANHTDCTGNCDFCNQITPTQFDCAGDNTQCSNTDVSCFCSGSGTSFNCQACNDCFDCSSYSCNPTSEANDGNCNQNCTNCTNGICVTRQAEDDVEVTKTCYWCDGVNQDPQPHSWGNGIGCVGPNADCTHCFNGNCIDWGPDECIQTSCEGVPCDTSCYDCVDPDGNINTPNAVCQAITDNDDNGCLDPNSCVGGGCCPDWDDNLYCDECNPGTDIICHTNYPTGTYYDCSPPILQWSHNVCPGNEVCRVDTCNLTNASMSSYTLPSGPYDLDDTITIPYTTDNVGDITWTFLDEAQITKNDSSNLWPAKWDTLTPGNSVSDTLTYNILCTDPTGDWFCDLYTYTDQSAQGGWRVSGVFSSKFKVEECIDNSSCQTCINPTYECKVVNNTCAPPCTGTISVSNDVTNCDNSQFTVTINNTGVDDLVVDIHDELWEDTNCDGIKEVKVDEASWSDVPINGLTHTTRQWSTIQAADPYRCYSHIIYFCSKPFAGNNRCWKSTSSCLSEANAGNMGIVEDSMFQCISGVGVCGDAVINIGEECDGGPPVRWGLCEPYEDCNRTTCECYDLKPECTGCLYYDYCTDGMDPLTGDSCCNDTDTYKINVPCCIDETTVPPTPTLNCSEVDYKLNPDANATPDYCFNAECDITGACVKTGYRLHVVSQTC